MSRAEQFANSVDGRIVQDASEAYSLATSPRDQILGDPVGPFILVLIAIAFLPVWINFFSSSTKPKPKQSKGKSNGKPRTITIQLGSDTDRSDS